MGYAGARYAKLAAWPFSLKSRCLYCTANFCFRRRVDSNRIVWPDDLRGAAMVHYLPDEFTETHLYSV